MSWFKVGLGLLALLTGLVWIGQGFNLIGGSPMSGHRGYALLGLAAAVIGALLLRAGGLSLRRTGQNRP